MATEISSLCERLENIASTLQALSPAHNCACGARTSSVNHEPFHAEGAKGIHDSKRVSGLAFVEAIMTARRHRSSLIDDDLLFDPAWSMLIDLYRAELCDERLSVTSLSIGSGVPDTTALRYLRLLEERGYIERIPDEKDRRRVFVKMTKSTHDEFARYFEVCESETFLQILTK